MPPEELFARGKVVYHAQPVGLVVAETRVRAAAPLANVQWVAELGTGVGGFSICSLCPPRGLEALAFATQPDHRRLPAHSRVRPCLWPPQCCPQEAAVCAARAVRVQYGPPDQPGIFSIEQARERSSFYTIPVRRLTKSFAAESSCLPLKPCRPPVRPSGRLLRPGHLPAATSAWFPATEHSVPPPKAPPFLSCPPQGALGAVEKRDGDAAGAIAGAERRVLGGTVRVPGTYHMYLEPQARGALQGAGRPAAPAAHVLAIAAGRAQRALGSNLCCGPRGSASRPAGLLCQSKLRTLTCCSTAAP